MSISAGKPAIALFFAGNGTARSAKYARVNIGRASTRTNERMARRREPEMSLGRRHLSVKMKADIEWASIYIAER